MAILSATPILSDGIARHYQWTPFAESGDVGVAINVFRHTRITVQLHGADYTGGLTIIAEGSLLDAIPTTNSDFFPLTNGAGGAVSFTADGGMVVIENVKWIRLRATAGSGGAAANGYILAVV